MVGRSDSVNHGHASIAVVTFPIERESSSPPPSTGATTATSPSSANGTPSPASSPSATPSIKSVSEDTGEANSEPKERRKRSRVSPEQLAILEAIFAVDRSPNAIRRKEISGQLGMTERQTQIWFQNRRAKAKQQDSGKVLPKAKAATSSPASPVAPPPTPQTPLYPSQDMDLQKRIREDEPVIVIPCTELSIGSWTRVISVSPENRYDLIAYICEARRRLTWFVHYHDNNVEHSVKMDIPFDHIANITLTKNTPDAAQASLFLSQLPQFFVEITTGEGDAAARVWAQCGDWTEDGQATSVLRHDLSGASAPLTYLWNRIRSDLRLAQGTAAAYTTPPSIALPSPPLREFGDLTLRHDSASARGFLGPARALQPLYTDAAFSDIFAPYATLQQPYANGNGNGPSAGAGMHPLLNVNTQLGSPGSPSSFGALSGGSSAHSPLTPAMAPSPASFGAPYASEYASAEGGSPHRAYAYAPAPADGAPAAGGGTSAGGAPHGVGAAGVGAPGPGPGAGAGGGAAGAGRGVLLPSSLSRRPFAHTPPGAPAVSAVPGFFDGALQASQASGSHGALGGGRLVSPGIDAYGGGQFWIKTE